MEALISSVNKRSYHPLVVFFFYAGMLKKEQLANIPVTTLQYWKNIDHKELYGYQWIKEFYTHHNGFNDIIKYRIVFKSARLCCRILNCFALLFSKVKGYKKSLKKNAGHVIATIDYLLSEIPLEKACKAFAITSNQYYRWKNKINCSASVLNLCFKTHPFQLSIPEVNTINETINKPENFFKPLCTLYYGLMRTGKLFCSLSTFYKYAGLLSERKKKGKVKTRIAFRAKKVFEYLHIDTTYVPTKEGEKRVAFVKDNRSKAILHKMILSNGKSEFIRDLLRITFERYNLFHHPDHIHIVSDGGPENKGELIKWIDGLGKNTVKKVTAYNEGFNHSNNMSESVHHIFKNEFLGDKGTEDEDELLKQLEAYDDYYNWNRFPVELYGYAPMEVAYGAIPDRNRFKQQIKLAQKERYIQNSNLPFCITGKPKGEIICSPPMAETANADERATAIPAMP